MTNTTSLLRCAHCHALSWYGTEAAERDRGDWILRCPVCNAENVLALHPETTPLLEIAGWRE